MGLEDSLYSELVELREHLREDRTHSTGRVPTVCTDEALREMAQRVPTKADDFAAIPGVGQRFVELYGDEFLSVTKKYAVTAARGSNMDTDVMQTLRELQKKLTNISRNNRLLYTGKIYRKTAFDLATISDLDIMSLLFGKKKSLKLCDSTKNAEELRIFKSLNELIREVNRDVRDKGQYDLYIGYPFVEGRLPGEDFDIRAPLALFPVILDKDAKSVSVRLDDSRDLVYNNALILAFLKFSGKNRPLPYNVIEDFSGETFMSNLVAFYESQGFPLKVSFKQPVPFVDYKAGEFPKYLPGDMRVIYNVILGKFPSYSSYIQKDFDELLAGREINAALSNLIKDLNSGDFYSDMPSPLSLPALREKGLEASEKEITYINSLNSAQENVITAVNKEDELVVQGPPGTGKSQVITGLITSAVNNGKTVLMVSEKKTALDVVYSRLGTLSKYCLLIDDVGNKEQFYQQLARMLESTPPRTGSNITALSESIDRDVSVLSNIADTMYHPGGFGIEPYKLYSMERWLNLEDKIDLERYKMIKAAVSAKMLDLKYGDVKELNRKFGDRVLMTNFNEYCECVEKTPWFVHMKPDLSEYNIGEMKADLMDLDSQMTEWKNKGFMSRMFSKGKVNREATAMLDKYFKTYSERTVQTVLDDPKGIINALNDYDLYSSRATVYDRLNERERIYGRDITALSKESGWSFDESNGMILKYILNHHLQKFDADHKALLQDIQDFDSIVADMDRKIGEKKKLTKDRVEEILQEHLRFITESKRRGDIVRIIENKRKWSLNKFIGRYSYELFKGVKIWLLTPEVVSEIMPLEMGLFDLLIFDEASQMYVEKGIPSIYRAKKVVVAGDHKQLRPSNLGSGRIDYSSDEDDGEEDEVSAVLEEESLLDLARTRYDNILLNFHYRSKYEELIAFSNYAFYGGKLYVSPNVTQPEKPPIEVHKVSGEWANKANVKEARVIVDLLKDFFKTRKDNETIGIISFNVAQRDLINDLIDDESAKNPEFGRAVNQEMIRFDNGEDVGLFIKNIESVQGDERDIIIFSIGYAKNKDGKLMQRFGWLNNKGGENRLNVAISRAKKKIHIVSSFDPEELQVENSKNDGPRILKKYLQYAEAVSSGEKELAASILESFGDNRWKSTPPVPGESPITEKVYNALVRKGYSVEKDVGIGGYQIDLAIKQENRYILGIECDSHIYEMSDSTRERDYHRQKYLESRGWHIHRVWTPGMWKDPQKEINNIVKAIERIGH